MIERGVGASAESPLADQRVREAVIARRPPARQFTWVSPSTIISAALDDLDDTSRALAAELLPAGGLDARVAAEVVRRVGVAAANLRRTTAFRSRFTASGNAAVAYRAWRYYDKQRVRYEPLRRLVPPSRTPTRGWLWPYRISSPSELSRSTFWRFIPDGDPVNPPTPVELVGRPSRPARTHL